MLKANSNKSYPRYKPSGIEWIGEIPNGWEIIRYRYIAHFKNGVNFDAAKRGDGYLTLDVLNMYADSLFIDANNLYRVNLNDVSEYILNEKDILFVRSSLKFEGVGWCSLFKKIDEPVIYSGFIIRARNIKKNIYPIFLCYYLRSTIGRYETLRNSNTVTITNISQNSIGNINIIFPTILEQQAIASFLDRETARINRIIEKQTRLIELLKEKRSALITQAVTRGLDTNAKMKDSGVEWIGEIPEGWGVLKLKYISMPGLTNGLFKKSNFYGSGTKLVNVYDIYSKTYIINYDELERVEADSIEKRTYSAKHGDIFFVRSSLKEEGVAASACLISPPENTVFECHLIRIRPKSSLINSSYLIYLLNSQLYREYEIALSQTTTMTTISQPKLASIHVIIPPIEIQINIIDYLNKTIDKIDKLTFKIEKQIELLNEYKQSLITAAVTGKIDVRNVQ